eukprot:CAMPEP_0180712804 /NCGR_PEP_ID=MMETSP1038_2-20121128/11560_1 /TAXON_ID=632150 /ORGANISM="Azadinium spinosum, Strain 3D9" /LENGTH=119 /DNA_ID=CAMNT_0022745079 /DNA_START=186 /DNA_END=546 /DNA_ORIENTATION=+
MGIPETNYVALLQHDPLLFLQRLPIHEGAKSRRVLDEEALMTAPSAAPFRLHVLKVRRACTLDTFLSFSTTWQLSILPTEIEAFCALNATVAGMVGGAPSVRTRVAIVTLEVLSILKEN